MSNLIKLLLGLGALLLVLGTNAVLFITNLISIDTALELLNTEARPVEHFPVVGVVIKALAPQATFANWVALGVATLMLLGAFVAFHYLFKIAYLVFDVQIYRRNNQPELVAAALDMIGRELMILAPVVLIMLPIVAGDLFLFTYARVAAAMNIDDPVTAVSEIGRWRDLAGSDGVEAAMWYATAVGPKMYLATSLLAPCLLEVVLTKIAQIWNRIWTALMALVQPQSEPASVAVDTPREHFGYDANGVPVYDQNAPIAYDVNQRAVPAAEALVRGAEVQATETAVEAAVTAFPAGEERLAVVGGRAGETVTLTQAQQQPAQYYVDRGTRRVYQRAFWNALNKDELSQGQDKPAAAA